MCCSPNQRKAQNTADWAKNRSSLSLLIYEAHLDEKTLKEVRASINKPWVLGSEHFKEKIASQLNRRASLLTKGGDRKSGKQGR